MSNRKRKATILFDKVVGEPIFKFLAFTKNNNQVKLNNSEIKNILLIRPGGIGDYLLTIPAFKRVRAKFPRAKITLFLFNRNKSCLEFYDDFNKVVVIDKPSSLIKFIASKRRYDLAIDFDQHRKISSILSLISNAKIRIGFKSDGKDRAYNNPINYKVNGYEGQMFLDLLKPLNISNKMVERDFILTKKAKSDKNRVGIYASAMKLDNRLSVDEWEKIIKKYGKDKTYYFIGGKNDSKRYDEIQRSLKGFKIVRLDGKLSLKYSMNEISKMNILLSEDGGTYHMGVCAGVPTISYWLHGKDNMFKWKAPFKKHKAVMMR